MLATRPPPLQPLPKMDGRDALGEKEAALGAVEAVGAVGSVLLVVPVHGGCLRPRHVGTGPVVGCSYRDDGKTPDQTTNTTPCADTKEGNKGGGAGGGGAVGRQ